MVILTYCITTDLSFVSPEEGPGFSQLLWPPGACCTSPSRISRRYVTHCIRLEQRNEFFCEIDEFWSQDMNLVLYTWCRFWSVMISQDIGVSLWVIIIITRFIIMSTGLTLCGFILSSIFLTCSNVGLMVTLWDQHFLISCSSVPRKRLQP